MKKQEEQEVSLKEQMNTMNYLREQEKELL